MAIGNLFLGTARKTIGDIVMYRRNGEQMSRVRVRKVANPRTEAQALQRNYMAPVTKFYAPLADVLERSWEGLNRQKSLGAFLKTNAELARSNGWYVVKGAGFTPLPYKVSNGSLQPLSHGVYDLTLQGEELPDAKVSTLSARLVDMGYQYGDQLTYIACLRDSAGDIRPVWSRVILSSSDDSVIFSDLATIIGFEVMDNQLMWFPVLTELVAVALIISRWNGSKWLRSSQYMVCDELYLEAYTSVDARAAAITSYQQGSSVVQSDVYLNGGVGTKAETNLRNVFKAYFSDTKEYAGNYQLISALPCEVGEVLKVHAVNIANGSVTSANIMMLLQGSRRGQVMFKQTESIYSIAALPPTESISIEWLGVNQSKKLRAWLRLNGVYI